MFDYLASLESDPSHCGSRLHRGDFGGNSELAESESRAPEPGGSWQCAATRRARDDRTSFSVAG
eukprot:336814-Hanusia_phi.AAC.1